MNYFITALMIFFIAIVLIGIAWQVGHFKFLGDEIKLSRYRILVGPATVRKKSVSHVRFGNLAFVIYGLITFEVAFTVSKYIFLCVLYGVSRVNTERLHLTTIPNGYTWMVSNGDRIGGNLTGLLFVICAIIWIFITFVGYVLIIKLLTRLQKSHHNVHFEKTDHLHQENTERRSLVEKGRPVRKCAILFLGLWALIIVIMGVFAEHIGRMVLILMPVVTIALYFIYVRFDKRYFALMVNATPCPKCGLVPMHYEIARDSNDHLLICDRCHIAWNLGPV